MLKFLGGVLSKSCVPCLARFTDPAVLNVDNLMPQLRKAWREASVTTSCVQASPSGFASKLGCRQEREHASKNRMEGCGGSSSTFPAGLCLLDVACTHAGPNWQGSLWPQPATSLDEGAHQFTRRFLKYGAARALLRISCAPCFVCLASSCVHGWSCTMGACTRKGCGKSVQVARATGVGQMPEASA